MKIPLKTAVAFAGLMFGVSTGLAHPQFNATCVVLDSSGHIGDNLTLNEDAPACSSQPGVPCPEEIDFNATPLGLAGETTITCRADNLGPGAATILNFNNTGEKCLLGQPPIATTQNWQEVITATGEAVMTCVFPPH